jgi:hypothetical protein
MPTEQVVTSPQKRGADNARLESIESRLNSLWGMIEPRLETLTERLDEMDKGHHRQPAIGHTHDMSIVIAWTDHLTGRSERSHIRVDRSRAFGDNLQALLVELCGTAHATLNKVLG